MDIWGQCRDACQPTALKLDAWRMVESQSISATRKIVDNLFEHEILEAEIESRKPRLNSDCQGYHYLLTTAFRYPPLKYGSRFGKKTEPSLWYGSMDIKTVLVESAYYGFALLMGSAMKSFNTPIPKTLYLSKIRTQLGLELTKAPFLSYREHISSPTQWQVSQMLGSALRDNQVEAFTYFSARDKTPTSTNVGVFHCKAFASKKPTRIMHLDQFMSRSSVEFINKDTKDHYRFHKDEYLVGGEFPFPPG